MALGDVKPAVSRAEDRMTGLDGGAMDPHHPAPARERRSSYETSTFSPHDSAWHGLVGFGMDANDSGMHTFFAPPSVPPSASLHSAAFSPHPGSGWPAHDHSGECTPTAGFDGMVDYHGQRSFAPPPHAGSATGFDPVAMPNAHLVPNTGFPPSSPQSKDGWFGQPADGGDVSMSAHTSPLSSSFATSTSILRRDGIRKKNARFEIPAERNLRTIDQLINQTTDEQEIKELKQQKRLLRNRQAALDSRQRKKQHTERLEDEKKHYTSVIGDLEEALADMKLQETEFQRQKEQWAQTQQHYQGYVDRLVMEKEELLRRHTIESGELRKRNALLLEQVQRLESTAMSTAPSSAGFSADFSDFDHLAMNSWDEFSLSNDFSLEADARTEMPLQHALAKKPESAKSAPGETDKAVTSSLLLMLLLCGAWVVSNGPKGATDQLLPSVPDEMRTASAAVLDSLYKDSGIQLQHGGHSDHTPRPTDRYEMAHTSQSSLETLHHRLVAPSTEQLHEQAFALTPRQYNDLTSGIGSYHSASYPHAGRTPPASNTGFPAASGHSVGDALAADAPSSAAGPSSAEAYTRSLLKGRVSAQVLTDFARMVARTQQQPTAQQHQPQWKSEPVD